MVYISQNFQQVNLRADHKNEFIEVIKYFLAIFNEPVFKFLEIGFLLHYLNDFIVQTKYAKITFRLTIISYRGYIIKVFFAYKYISLANTDGILIEVFYMSKYTHWLEEKKNDDFIQGFNIIHNFI